MVEPLRIGLEPSDVEYWPLDKLRQLQEQRLQEGRLLELAATSSLYAGRWPRLPGSAGLGMLQSLPFTTAADLLQVEGGGRLKRLAVAPAYLWVSSASAGDRKWVPLGAQDLLRSMGLAARLIRLLRLEPSEVVLVVSQPAPLFQNGLPYHWLYADRWETGLHLELVIGSMAMAEHNNWPEFALRRQPSTIVARPGDLLALVERFSRAGGGDSPRQALPRLRRALCYGQPLAPCRAELEVAYGVPAFSLYASAEYPCSACECSAHDGLHLWLDLAVPEIIPADELARAAEQPGHRPQAVFFDQARAGLEGELVVTTFAQALPMVRYRTGDHVRLVSLDPCACGCTHPRIEVMGRI